MEKMNLFDAKGKQITFPSKGKPSKRPYSTVFKRRAIRLSDKIGNANAARKLGIAPGTINNWRKILNIAPIQDSKGNLTFSLAGNTYTLNVKSEEEREKIKNQVNSKSEHIWEWVKEETGKKHWVLFNTEMYAAQAHGYLAHKKTSYDIYNVMYLHYNKESGLPPEVPINATSCDHMFAKCGSVQSLDMSKFDTYNIVTMDDMFLDTGSWLDMDLTGFDTVNVINANGMFTGSYITIPLDLSSFSFNEKTDIKNFFLYCTVWAPVKVTDERLRNYIKETYPEIQLEG